MKDPTREEMIEFLTNKWKGLLDFRDGLIQGDIEAAIYQFAGDYHSGQNSNLYSALSTSRFHPGPIWRLGNEEIAKDLYDSLVSEYGE